jgi:hypothetical protein
MDDYTTVFVIVMVMILCAIKHRKQFTYEIYKDYEFINKKLLWIEKILMIVLPILFTFLYVALFVNPIVIRVWLILVILLDFTIQYLAKECHWIKGEIKRSNQFIYYIIFMVALFFTIK